MDGLSYFLALLLFVIIILVSYACINRYCRRRTPATVVHQLDDEEMSFKTNIERRPGVERAREFLDTEITSSSLQQGVQMSIRDSRSNESKGDGADLSQRRTRDGGGQWDDNEIEQLKLLSNIGDRLGEEDSTEAQDAKASDTPAEAVLSLDSDSKGVVQAAGTDGASAAVASAAAPEQARGTESVSISVDTPVGSSLTKSAEPATTTKTGGASSAASAAASAGAATSPEELPLQSDGGDDNDPVDDPPYSKRRDKRKRKKRLNPSANANASEHVRV